MGLLPFRPPYAYQYIGWGRVCQGLSLLFVAADEYRRYRTGHGVNDHHKPRILTVVLPLMRMQLAGVGHRGFRRASPDYPYRLIDGLSKPALGVKAAFKACLVIR